MCTLFSSLYPISSTPWFCLLESFSVASICSLVKAFWFMVGVTNKQILTSGPLQDLCVHTHKYEINCAHCIEPTSSQVHSRMHIRSSKNIQMYWFTSRVHTHTHENLSNIQYAHLHLLPWQWSITFPPFLLCKPPEVNRTHAHTNVVWSHATDHSIQIQDFEQQKHAVGVATLLTAVTGQSWWVTRFLMFTQDVTPTALLLTIISAIKNLKPYWMLGKMICTDVNCTVNVYVIYKTLLWSFNMIRAQLSVPMCCLRACSLAQ